MGRIERVIDFNGRTVIHSTYPELYTHDLFTRVAGFPSPACDDAPAMFRFLYRIVLSCTTKSSTCAEKSASGGTAYYQPQHHQKKTTAATATTLLHSFLATIASKLQYTHHGNSKF
jgi:hypothetical protein